MYYSHHYRIFVYNIILCVSLKYIYIYSDFVRCVFVYILTLPLDGKGLLFEHRSIETKNFILKKN